jgi:DNA-binding NtrC family response regulator
MDSFVLVVDDEENLLVLLNAILSKEGYQVKTANSAYEALDFVDQKDIRVAILDIRMYPIDGVALLTEIKKRSPTTQAIIMTAFLSTETQNTCLKYGAANYITKPLDVEKLKRILRGLFAK